MKRYREFHVGFLWDALGFALFGGFALAVVMALQIGNRWVLPPGWLTWIQVHGHVQLFGWAGAMIMGVSLYFLPRFVAVPIPRPSRVSVIRWTLLLGLAVETVVRWISATWNHRSGSWFDRTFIGSGVFLQVVAVGLYTAVVGSLFRHPQRKRSQAVHQVRPFFLMMLTGWWVYTLTHAGLAVTMLRQGTTRMDPAWHRWTVEVCMFVLIFPVAYAFSVRTFPLFLNVVPVRGRVHLWALGYALVELLHLIVRLPVHASWTVALFGLDGPLRLVRSAVMLGMIGKLHLVPRRPPPWVIEAARVQARQPNRTPSRPHRMPRKHFPDYGEFGRFEWLLYGAYAWLSFGLVIDAGAAAMAILGRVAPYGEDAFRHSFLMGFVTLLILGMAQRMLPGFMHRKGVAVPALVAWTAVFAHLGALLRVGPMLMGFAVFRSMGIPQVSLRLFAWSGICAWIAVALLAVQMLLTYRSGK